MYSLNVLYLLMTPFIPPLMLLNASLGQLLDGIDCGQVMPDIEASPRPLQPLIPRQPEMTDEMIARYRDDRLRQIRSARSVGIGQTVENYPDNAGLASNVAMNDVPSVIDNGCSETEPDHVPLKSSICSTQV